MEHGDFLEGIRAAIIDKDRRRSGGMGLAWHHRARREVSAMLLPLGATTTLT
jgi:hypothetical protein